jgi:hypothetical protein
MLMTALKTDLPLELSYSEHVCECLRGLSPEAELFARELLFPQEDLHEAKLPAFDSL